MAEPAELQPRARVRLLSAAHVLTLRADTGYVVRPDEWDDYFIIRLDQPALYHHADGRIEDLWEVRELADNLELIQSEARAAV